MTVIAYTNGVLAADTKAVDDDNLVIKSQKIFKLPNRSMIGTAGDADCRDVLNILSKSSITKMPAKSRLVKTETMFHGIWVFHSGEVFRVNIKNDAKWEAEILPILDGYVACGSGGAYALGAMLAGKSALEAVKIACKLDNNCGLPAESMKISEL